MDNLWVDNTHQLPSFGIFVWARLHNLFRLLSPFFLVVWPFDLTRFVHEYWACLPGATGLILYLPGLIATKRILGSLLATCAIVVPCLLLDACFSNVAIISLEGFQPIVGLLTFAGVGWLYQKCGSRARCTALGTQLVINLAMIVAHGVVNGVRF